MRTYRTHHSCQQKPLPSKRQLGIKYPTPDPNKVREVIHHVAQCLNSPNCDMLYIDEMHFNLRQTALHRWTKKSVRDLGVVNQRDTQDIKLTVIAMCSTRRFEFIQVFRRDINSKDFVYFLDVSLSLLPRDKKYSILADNAKWHLSDTVKQFKAFKYLSFNVPRMFQLNMIENAFSYVRHAFRCRPLVETIEDETKLLVDMFFDEKNDARFEGYHRNHLRNLRKYLSNVRLNFIV